jgi:hypothetical protein
VSKSQIIADLAEKFDVSLPTAAGIVEHFETTGWKAPYEKSGLERLEELIAEEQRSSVRIDIDTSGVRYPPMNDPRMGPPNPPNPTWNRPFG